MASKWTNVFLVVVGMAVFHSLRRYLSLTSDQPIPRSPQKFISSRYPRPSKLDIEP